MTPLLVQVAPPRPERAPVGWLGWVGVAVATALGFVTALWESFLAPLSAHWTSHGHAHFTRVPVALLAAVVLNAALVWFVQSVTGRLVLVLGPFMAWVLVVVLASARTAEGDLVLTSNNWVAVALIFVGAVTFAVTAIGLALREARAAARSGTGLAPPPPAR